MMSGPTSVILPFSSTAPETATSLTVTVPSNQLNPGNYQLFVTNFDGQSARAPDFFVVP
jgi:hypothetical protein